MIERVTPSIILKGFILACIVIASVFFRLSYIQSTVMINPIQRDSFSYISYGYNLAYHGTFSKDYPSDNPTPDSFRSPGYPLVIALAFLIGGKSGFYNILLNCQAVLGGIIPVLIFFTAILFFPYPIALAASIFVLFSPHLISFTSCCLTETLFSFTLALAILFYLRALKSDRRILYIFSALFCGYSYLVNETFFFLPYILVFVYFVANKKYIHKNAKKNLVIFVFVFSLFPFIWMARNALTLSPDALTGKTRAIETMSHGSYPDFIYKSQKYKYLPYREDPEQPEFGSSLTNFTKILWKRIKQRPLDYLIWYCLKKPYYLWSWNILQGQGDVYMYPIKQSLYSVSSFANLTKSIIYLIHPLMIFFSFIGIPLIFLKKAENRPGKEQKTFAMMFYIIFIYYTFLYMVFAPWPRYSIPLRPVFYICALWSMKSIAGRFRKRIHQLK